MNTMARRHIRSIPSIGSVGWCEAAMEFELRKHFEISGTNSVKDNPHSLFPCETGRRRYHLWTSSPPCSHTKLPSNSRPPTTNFTVCRNFVWTWRMKAFPNLSALVRCDWRDCLTVAIVTRNAGNVSSWALSWLRRIPITNDHNADATLVRH